MGSPYPWHYSLRWPFYHLCPSTRIHSRFPPRPLRHDFADTAGQQMATVLCFGDLMGLTGDHVPACDPELCATFARADLVIGNCEAPVTRDERDPRALYLTRFDLAERFLVEVFERFGIAPERCVLSVANNHAGDRGAAGLSETLARLGGLGVTAVGARVPGGAPLVTRTLHGLRLGIAAWTEWLNCDVFAPHEGVLRTADVTAHPWRTTREGAVLDCLIGAPHWEWEFQHFPRPETVKLARTLAGAGFDLLVGHHPHVLQPVAFFDHTVCAFSLGNLFARTLTWPHRLAALFETRIALTGPRRGRVASYACHPIVQLGAGREVRVVPLAGAPSGLRQRMEARLALIFDGRMRPAPCRRSAELEVEVEREGS